jgi:mitogen-activated protein kinase kinase
MSSPAPLLRPPIPGARSQSGTRMPRLTLGIPPSPSVKPVAGEGQASVPEMPQLRSSSRPTAPKLSLATPMGSQGAPQEPRPSSRPSAPKLSLATPMGSHGALQEPRPSSRPSAPKLSLATPMGSYGAPQEPVSNLRPQIQPLNMSAVTGSSDASNHSRSGSFTVGDGRASRPDSASSSTYSALSFAMGLRQGQMGTPDPSSAISSVYSEVGGGTSMEREGSMNSLLVDLEQLSMEKGRPLDVGDLDDEGWRAASEMNKVIELGSLGEGAGGAVTRCTLEGGKTVFALKVCSLPYADLVA